jgi:ParB family chromosome partitioning protein
MECWSEKRFAVRGMDGITAISTTATRLATLNAQMDALLAEQASRRHLIYLPPPPPRHRGSRDAGDKRKLKMDDGMVRMLALGQVRLSEAGVRQRFADDELSELAKSIRDKGMLQPLVVRSAGASFEVVMGARRYRAAERAGLREVPVIVRDVADTEAIELALVENLQREDLSPLEEAEGYRRLLELRGCTQESLAAALGKSRCHVANTLRLLSLPDPVRRMLEEGELSAGHARALLAAPDPVALADDVVRRGLSVRVVERLACQRPSQPKRRSRDADTEALERELCHHLGLRVALRQGRRGGVLALHYSSREQLSGLVTALYTVPAAVSAAA